MTSLEAVNERQAADAGEQLATLLAEAIEQQLAGNVQHAARSYRSILQVHPHHATANHCLGMLQVQLGRATEAVPLLRTALTESPQVPDYWLGYLEALLLSGRIDEAKHSLTLGREQGLAGTPVDDFEQRLRRQAMQTSGDLGDRRASSAVGRVKHRRTERQFLRQEKAVRTLMARGEMQRALELSRSLVERFPARGAGWTVLGALQWCQGSAAEALPALQQAARLSPVDAGAHTNLALALTKLGRYEEAESGFRTAIHLKPGNSAAHVHLASLHQMQGHSAEALARLRQGIAIDGDTLPARWDMRFSCLFSLLSRDPDIGPDELFAEHRRVGEILEAKLPRSGFNHRNERNPNRRLKVAWVSGDFYNHVVAAFVEPVLARLSERDAFEMHAYYSNSVEDDVTRRMRRYFAGWTQVDSLSAVQLARRIARDRIDVLIDLSGHTAFNRLDALARKPAPVQASWIGYPGTTGLRAMDYYLADPHFFPPGRFERHFTEQLVYMPANAAFRPHAAAPAVNGLPALHNGALTFASFNTIAKINPAVIALWSRLLNEVPAARLLIANIENDAQERRLLDQFKAHGIDAMRLDLHRRANMDDYLRLHHQVDLCLDTFPYAGGTTTFHAVTMGVPTLTLDGETPAARQGVAILAPLDLDGFIATDHHDFVAKGRYWATRTDELSLLRAGLRERWQQAPGRKAENVANGLEQAVRTMWRRWCSGQAPCSFQIEAGHADGEGSRNS